MKKLLLLSLLLFFPSCEYIVEEIEIGKLYSYDFQNDIEINSVEEALYYVTYDIEYLQEPPGTDYWQTPEETENFGTGDCEDKSILLMYLLQKNLKLYSFLLIVKNVITNDCHALVLSDDLFLESANNTMQKELNPKFEIIFIIPYPEVIWMTVFHHGNVGKHH